VKHRDWVRTNAAYEKVRADIAKRYDVAPPDSESASTASLSFIPEAELPNKHLRPLTIERERREFGELGGGAEMIEKFDGREYRTATAAFYYLVHSMPRNWSPCQISSIRGSVLIYPVILSVTFFPAYFFFRFDDSHVHLAGSVWFTFLFPILCCIILPKLFERVVPNDLRFQIEPHVTDPDQKSALSSVLTVCRRHCAPHEIRVKIQDRQLLILFLTDFRGKDAAALVAELDSLFEIGLV